MAEFPATSQTQNSAFLLFLLQVVNISVQPQRAQLRQVPRAWTTICRRSFAVAGPSLWNSLPAALRKPDMTLPTFKRQLKVYLMSWWTEGTSTTARHCCGVSCVSWFWRGIQNCLYVPHLVPTHLLDKRKHEPATENKHTNKHVIVNINTHKQSPNATKLWLKKGFAVLLSQSYINVKKTECF